MFLPAHLIQAWKDLPDPTLFPSASLFHFLPIRSSSRDDVKIRSEARTCWKVERMGQVSSLLYVRHLKYWLHSYRRWIEGMLWKVKGEIFTEKGTIRPLIQKTEILWQTRNLPLKKISLWTPLHLLVLHAGSVLWMYLSMCCSKKIHPLISETSWKGFWSYLVHFFLFL